MSEQTVVQIIISQLRPDASREQFLSLHEKTHDWMQAHPDCLAYEVFEGDNGSIADRISWNSLSGAVQANREYTEQGLAKEMESIIESFTSFMGNPVSF